MADDLLFSDFPIRALQKSLFKRQPLLHGEFLVALLNRDRRQNWTRGWALTNKALIIWTNKKTRRYNLKDMAYIRWFLWDENIWSLRFTYTGKRIRLLVPKSADFHKFLRNAIPESAVKIDPNTEALKQAVVETIAGPILFVIGYIILRINYYLHKDYIAVGSGIDPRSALTLVSLGLFILSVISIPIWFKRVLLSKNAAISIKKPVLALLYIGSIVLAVSLVYLTVIVLPFLL